MAALFTAGTIGTIGTLVLENRLVIAPMLRQ
jgi:2,4-dienoyl-CoA reductase-like NADH-dependent reductase (Old Yellow Enzyme family)